MSGRHRAGPLRPRRTRGAGVFLAPIVGIAALVLASTTDGTGAPEQASPSIDESPDPTPSGAGDYSALIPELPALPAVPLLPAAPSTPDPAPEPAPPPAAAPEPAPVTTTPAAPRPASAAQQVIALTNEERAAAGCAPLRSDPALTRAAQAHSDAMSEEDFFAHTDQRGDGPGERVSEAGYSWRAVAENIASGQRTPEQVVAGWMGSPGHRANILDCGLTEIGVGRTGNYWVQDFGTPR